MIEKLFNIVAVGLVVVLVVMALPVTMSGFLITRHLDLCIRICDIELTFCFPALFSLNSLLALGIISRLLLIKGKV